MNIQAWCSFLMKACKKYKDQVAYENMGVKLTFEQVDILSGHFAAYLQKDLGLKKGERIAIQMPNLLQFPIAFMGAIRAGLIVVNTNPLYTAREMEYQFKDAGISAIVIVANFCLQPRKSISQYTHQTYYHNRVGGYARNVKRSIGKFCG